MASRPHLKIEMDRQGTSHALTLDAFNIISQIFLWRCRQCATSRGAKLSTEQTSRAMYMWAWGTQISRQKISWQTLKLSRQIPTWLWDTLFSFLHPKLLLKLSTAAHDATLVRLKARIGFHDCLNTL